MASRKRKGEAEKHLGTIHGTTALFRRKDFIVIELTLWRHELLGAVRKIKTHERVVRPQLQSSEYVNNIIIDFFRRESSVLEGGRGISTITIRTNSPLWIPRLERLTRQPILRALGKIEWIFEKLDRWWKHRSEPNSPCKCARCIEAFGKRRGLATVAKIRRTSETREGKLEV